MATLGWSPDPSQQFADFQDGWLSRMAKASKSAKARVRRATVGEKAQIRKAARMLADFDLITQKRHDAIVRATEMRR
jgi:hypothetical protein